MNNGKETHTHMNKTPMSGYEIRLEILKLAKDHADTAWYHKNESSHQIAISKGNEHLWVPEKDDRVEETLKVADLFYKFVEEKK